MSTKSRRDRLRELIQTRGFAALGELAETLNVSESTIRRDLEELEKAGDARRTHGGVFWTGKTATIRVFGNRRDTMWPAKSAIGLVAAELVDDHDTILLDGGSTTYELARHLVKRPLQVVTNSLPVAHLLSSSESIDLIMIGGCVRGRTAVAIGPMADSMLHTLNVGKAFLSVAGINERGYFNSDMMLVESEKAMIAAADQSIVVTDSSKFGKVSLSRLCGLHEVNAVVTDSGIDSEWKERLEKAGVGLVLANPSGQNERDAARSGLNVAASGDQGNHDAETEQKVKRQQ
ncbi:transcriptional regulator, DeoR family [Rhodopirellula maiorica SM1]|uniref:Transcriptional regulator, DeoR family n=1 Tax=Rhodopirellula maiorica SM1 TaxID=1265738 RepID=M5RNC8_9BACT|nr:DeoR/GlpR family DNA-binding transcription regulator [Rhodopirellula maiorica]EMI20818.1 transcriptional regulator, DeoR family [Rhodopirellula maiorica SM1]